MLLLNKITKIESNSQRDAEGISYDGQTLATWKAPKPSKKFDANALQVADPDTYAKYVTTQQGARRFLLK